MDENPLSVSLGDTVTTFVRDNVTFSRVVVNEYEEPSNIEDETSCKESWKRLAYVVFEASTNGSSLQSLVLESAGESAGRCVFSHADPEAFCAVALSEYPEEERFNCPVESSAVELTVLTFSDDGESEWVNVVAPGYVESANLDFSSARSKDTDTHGVTSLQLHFDRDRSLMKGLPQLLAAIGPK
ncbi:hypothetical protein GQ600_11642 [Phytophthora cactorum]|nr:hypothetical protein GQ600_11642 [Phytophthora cactorum]